MAVTEMMEAVALLENMFLEQMIVQDISIAEAFSLHVIRLMEEPTMVTLANTLQISQSNATYLIGKLVDRGYITRIRSDRDKREYHLVLTDKFSQTVGKNQKRIQDLVSDVLKTYTAKDRKVIEQFFEQVKKQLLSIQ